ncbi:MAG: class I SAM-dependent methyltransferase [Patulibacter sp.]
MSSALGRVFQATKEANRQAIIAELGGHTLADMLDIGPHKGDYTARVAEAVGATNVHGIELIPDHIDDAKQRGIAVTLGNVDDGLPYADASFDLVLANQVIEHVRNTDRFFTEIRRVLRPDGIACVSTNNMGSWHNVVSLALGHQPMPMHVSDEIIVGNPLNPEHGWQHEDLGRTHLRLFTTRALVELAAHHGLRATSTVSVGYYPLPPKIARYAVRCDPRHSAYMIVLLQPA